MRGETLHRVEERQAWAPHAYQKRAIRFLVERACAGLFLDPG